MKIQFKYNTWVLKETEYIGCTPDPSFVDSEDYYMVQAIKIDRNVPFEIEEIRYHIKGCGNIKVASSNGVTISLINVPKGLYEEVK